MEDKLVCDFKLAANKASCGYPVPLIQKQLSRALYHSNTTPCPSRDAQHFSLTTTYYLGLHRLKRILREGFHILSSDPSTQDLLTKPPPPPVTFCKPPNLLQFMVDTSLRSGTNLTYPLTTNADCKSMNLIYQLQCNVCEAFYIGETHRMNGHRFTTTVPNSDLPVVIHTQSHQIPFQDCWSVSIIHKLPDSTPDHIRRQLEIAYQLVLQSRHTPGINIR